MSIANQIRALALDRTDIASALADRGVDAAGHGFDDFAADIAAIPEMQLYYDGAAKLPYVKHMILEDFNYCDLASLNGFYKGAQHMESLEYRFSGTLGGNALHQFPTNAFADCANLKSVRFPFYKGCYTGGYADSIFINSPIEEFVAGSIGHPLDNGATLGSAGTYAWFNTSAPMTITVYLDVEHLSDVPRTYTSRQPWGAQNATVVYRNSTTGEVLE